MTRARLPAPGPIHLDEWERAWQEHWSKVGLPGYELPVGGPGGGERMFLAHARTVAKEKERLKRITGEFARAFKGILPPAVRRRLKPALTG